MYETAVGILSTFLSSEIAILYSAHYQDAPKDDLPRVRGWGGVAADFSWEVSFLYGDVDTSSVGRII